MMSDGVAPSSIKANATKNHNQLSNKAALIILGCMFVGWTIWNYIAVSDQHIKTLQSIINDDASLKTLKVRTVRIPFRASVPLSGILTEFGIFPGTYDEYFSVERRDGKEMAGNCKFNTYAYSFRHKSLDQEVISIDGKTLSELKACN